MVQQHPSPHPHPTPPASTEANIANAAHSYCKDRMPFTLGPQGRLAHDAKYGKLDSHPPHSLSELSHRAGNSRTSYFRWPGKYPAHTETTIPQPAPSSNSKPCRAYKLLHLPSVAVAVKVAVPWLQDLQKDQAKRQRGSCLAPGLPEELHSVSVRGAEVRSSSHPRLEVAHSTPSTRAGS